MRYLILVLVMLAGTCYSQPVLPNDAAFAGVAWNQYASPQINGWASYAKQIGKGVYSFTSYDVSSVKARPFTVQTSTRTGIALWLRTIGPFQVLGLGDAGAAVSGTNIGGAYSGGGVVAVPIGKKGFAMVAGARVLKTALSQVQTVYEFGMGWVRQ